MAEEDVKTTNEEIAKAAREMIKSKNLRTTGGFGTSNLFDLSKHSNLDYTAGGALAPRFVKTADGAIERRRIEGYVLPEEISPRLKNISFGGLTLMVRSEEARKDHAEGLAKEADKVSGSIMKESEIVKKHPDKFVDFEAKSTKVMGAFK